MIKLDPRVLEAIAKERAHQIEKYGIEHDATQSLAGYLMIIQSELDEAKEGWICNTPGRDSALSELIQVAATAIAALEKFGLEGNPQ